MDTIGVLPRKIIVSHPRMSNTFNKGIWWVVFSQPLLGEWLAPSGHRCCRNIAISLIDLVVGAALAANPHSSRTQDKGVLQGEVPVETNGDDPFETNVAN